jgi:hypothetical protein
MRMHTGINRYDVRLQDTPWSSNKQGLLFTLGSLV